MNYWFLYDETTGAIYPQQPSDKQPQTQNMGVLGPYPVDTASSTVVMAYTYPQRFLAQGSPVALVEQPYFTISLAASSTKSNEFTATATLNNPPTTPPTTATFTLGGVQYTETLTNNVATFTFDVHPSVASYQIAGSVSATGCVAATFATNTNAAPPIATASYTPTGGNPTVAPTGTGSKTYLESYYALNAASLQSLLADIGTAINLLTDVVFGILLPQAQSATYTPVTLSANQTNAVSDVKTNVLPNVYTTLEKAFPNGGVKQTQYAHYAADLERTFNNYTSYENDLATIPNLA